MSLNSTGKLRLLQGQRASDGQLPFHRMLWVGRDLEDPSVPPPCHGQGPLPPAQGAPSPDNLALNPAREGAATASLGSLGQGLTTLTGKNFFLISNLHLLSFSVKPSPLVLLLPALARSPSPALLQAPPGTGKLL